MRPCHWLSGVRWPALTSSEVVEPIFARVGLSEHIPGNTNGGSNERKREVGNFAFGTKWGSPCSHQFWSEQRLSNLIKLLHDALWLGWLAFDSA